jgi:hypothetical protein
MRHAVKEEMRMNTRTLSILLIGFALLAGCTMPASTMPPATPLALPTSTLSIASPTPASLPVAAATPAPGVTPAPAAGNPSSICNDPQVTALIDSFKSAVQKGDGPLFGSLVSPSRGMEVAYFRDGTAITYDQNHAKFLFETTYQVDWGREPGSGAAKRGAFHDVVIPKLRESFGQAYELHCNELSHGGATYELKWPYQGEFYSIYFPGTQANGNMDWHTWAMGIEYANGKPYVYALRQFFWEP